MKKAACKYPILLEAPYSTNNIKHISATQKTQQLKIPFQLRNGQRTSIDSSQKRN